MSDLLIEAVLRRLRDDLVSWPDVERVDTYSDALALVFSDNSRLWIDVQEDDND